MNRLSRLILEIAIFFVMGIITFIEMNNYQLFQSFVSFFKVPASWFIGLNLAFIFSYFFQNILIGFFRGGIIDEKERKDFFVGFIIAVVITSFITPYVRQLILSFFNLLIPYFHVIIFQAIIIFYLLFKINGGYEIPTKYFLINEVITLFYTIVILSIVT